MISAADPVLQRVKLSDRDISRIPDIPWNTRLTQVVNGKECLVLEIDGQRIRLLLNDNKSVTMDGPENAVDYVMFWIRS